MIPKLHTPPAPVPWEASAATLWKAAPYPEESLFPNTYSTPKPLWGATTSKTPPLLKVPLRVLYTTTADGLDLALGNYHNPGGQPVILLHGLAQNYKIWDFPMEGHNFAHYLFERGYDIWLPSLRGHGYGPIQSSPARGDESIDDIAIYDVSAIIDKVCEETQKAPIWIGHSLGGMLAYMYLQGIQYGRKTQTAGQPPEIPQAPSLNLALGDLFLSEERNRKLKALVTMGTPVKMVWRFSDGDVTTKLGFWNSNKVLPLIANFKTLRSVFSCLPYVPIASFLHFLSYNRSVFHKVTHWSVHRLANSFFSSLFWYPPNMNRRIIDHFLHNTLNDVGPYILEQFADWVQNETFRTAPGRNNPCAPYVYSDNFDKIKLPLLVLSGNRDKIAPAEIIYHQGYLKMGSPEKQYHCLKNVGHNDMTVGLCASKEIYPLIENWIRRYRE